MNNFLMLLVCFIFFHISYAQAREIAVSPSDVKNGFNEVINAAANNDTIILKKGIYKNSLLINKPLNIKGEDGAVIDPSEKLSIKWTAAWKYGNGVYKAFVVRQPYAIFLEGKPVARLDEKRSGQSKNDWSWESLIASGPKRGGFNYIKGLFVYIADEKTVYIHFENDVDPSKLDLAVLWEKKPGVEFSGAVNATLEGLRITHAFNGIEFSEKSSTCTVKNCIVDSWEMNGIKIGGGTAYCTIDSNDITRNSLEDWTPPPNSVDDETRRTYYEIWQIHKNTGFYDRVGILLYRAGYGNRILSNHIYETFDGVDISDPSIESNKKPLVNPDDNKGTEIAGNKIENTRDSGIELGTGCIDVKVHHNILQLTHGGLRFKVPRIGPVYIYRNYLIDNRPFNIWFSMDDSSAEGYVYHNTIAGGQAALMYSSMPDGLRKTGTPNWHFYNNIFVSTEGFFKNVQNPSPPVNFICDYNLVVGGGRPYDKTNPNDAHSYYINDAQLTKDFPFIPKPGSKAIQTGLDLSALLNGKGLPGCEKGYFRGKAPDLGAYE